MSGIHYPGTDETSYNFRCPQCSFTEYISLECNAVATITKEGDLTINDDIFPDWKDDTPAWCGACAYVGIYRDFSTELPHGEGP